MDALKMYGAVSKGVTDVMKWQQEFMREFTEPLTMMKARSIFHTLPPAVKEAMQKADPKQYAQLVDKLRKGE